MSTSASLCPCGTRSRTTRPSSKRAPGPNPPSFATMATLSAGCIWMRWGLVVIARGSVDRDLARFDQLFPAGVLGGLELGEVLGRVGDDLEALGHQLVLDGRVVQHRGDGVAQLGLDVGG